MQDTLINKIQSKQAVVGIIGLGYVGLPLALRFSEAGFRVLGFDIDPEKVLAINDGRSFIKHIASTSIQRAKARGFEATTDLSRSGEPDALLICVPTPLGKYREPDLSFVTGTVDAVTPHLRKGQLIVLESTTYPGTTDEEVLPRVESRGFKAGKDIFVCFSPEREDPGNERYCTQTIPKLCGGVTPTCLAVGVALYQQAIERVVPVSSTRVAEMAKLLENIHRAVNIGLVNEMKIIADRMNLDIYEIIEAAATKPFGFVPYYPGPGLGGHCIPIDPFYLTWKAREYGIHTRFIELAGEVNNAMPAYVVERTIEALNVRGKALKGAKILMLGIAYKKNVDDMRESPALDIMEMIVGKGGAVSYSDPHVLQIPKLREHRFNLSSVPLTPDSLPGYDCCILTTHHDLFDYEMIRKYAQLIIDTRGVYRGAHDNVQRA